jgi:hypothetical protein
MKSVFKFALRDTGYYIYETDDFIKNAGVIFMTEPKPQSYYDNAPELDSEDSAYLNQAILDNPEQFQDKKKDDNTEDSFWSYENIVGRLGTRLDHFLKDSNDLADKIADITLPKPAANVVRNIDAAMNRFVDRHLLPTPTHTTIKAARYYTAPADVMAAIKKACAVTGCDYDLAVRTAGIESGMNPNAANGRSSARGLYQALTGTAEKVIASDPRIAAEIAKDGGYNPFNPYHSALVGTLYAVQNQRILQASLHHVPSQGEMYLAHFLGASGAMRVLRYNHDAQLNLSGAVLKANPNLKDMRTVGDLVSWADNKMANVHVNDNKAILLAQASTRPHRDDHHLHHGLSTQQARV